MEKDDILPRWEEYIGDLFHETHVQKSVIHKNIDGAPILESEIRAVIKKAKLNEAPGPDAVHTEMLKVVDEFGVKKVTDIANEIYNKAEFPTDLSKSVFITLPKKGGTIECELHRTISLMSHVTKLTLSVLLHRIRRAISPEIADVQCGFVKDKGTRNTTFIMGQLFEISKEHKQDLYICFLDYSKAFDSVRHKSLMHMLHTIDGGGKDLRLLRNLYWHQTAAVRVDNELSGWTKIQRGVR